MNHLIIIFLAMMITFTSGQAQNREYYQIKVYSFDNIQQQNATDRYLEDAYLPALKRMDINSIGVFKTRPENSEGLGQTYVLIPMKQLAQLETIPENLSADSDYLRDGKDYLEASYDHPPYARIESIILHAFEKMSQMKPSPLKGPREDRVYELRSYESPTEALHVNKVEMFNKGGEVDIFADLGFNAVFYGDVISGGHMPNLMYMTTFSDQKSQTEHWDSFRTAPAWNALKVLPQYQNNVSHSDKFYLYPTDYSDY